MVDITAITLPADSPFSVFRSTANKGDPLPLSPKNRVSLTATYTLPLDESIGKLSLGATFVHTDAQNSSSPTVTPLYRIPATDLLNLNVNWDGAFGAPLDLAFFATNVTNEIYPVSVTGGFFTQGFDGLLMAPPRTWGFRLRYNFGV